MNMACVQSTAVNLFDEYCLLIPPKLKSYQDGPPGQREVTSIEGSPGCSAAGASGFDTVGHQQILKRRNRQ